jgi:dTDP-4-amino-4,6-dideoxygalactose transaminase
MISKRRWPFVTPEDKEAVLRVMERGVLFSHKSPGEEPAPEVSAFEHEFANFIGVKYALLVNSGTAALHIALKAAGVGEGDEVITTPLSYIATPMSIMHAGAKPVFADIDLDTHNIDPLKIEEKITSRTKAILIVHMDGLMCDMEKIMSIASKHGFAVIEDCARAHGSTYGNRRAGSIGHAAGFSINGTKTLAVGEGGVFVTNSKAIFEKAKQIATMAAGPGEQFDDNDSPDNYPDTVSYTYKAQELIAALARSKLKLLKWVNENSKRNCDFLNAELRKIPGVHPQASPPGTFNPHYKYRIRIDPEVYGVSRSPREFRNRIMTALRAEGVDVSFDQLWPLPALPVFRKFGYRAEDYPQTQKLLDSSFILGNDTYPIFAQPFEIVQQAAEAIKKVFASVNKLL